MLFLYSCLWYLLLPLALLRLWWRGRLEPGYRQHILERLGHYTQSLSTRPVIWVHAVSVGETRAAEPLIHQLLTSHPSYDILLTHMTPTGRATGKTLFGQNARVTQAYLPYDTGWFMHRLIQHFHPTLCILVETEIWPNLITQCRRHGVKLALVNARLSERSLKKGERFSGMMRALATQFDCVAAQTETDAHRLRQFGSAQVHVVGSTKFDVQIPETAIQAGLQLRSCIGNRPVLICASTREDEEKLILEQLDALQTNNLLLILVPRHPQRFESVAQLIQAQGIPFVKRSDMDMRTPVPAHNRIVLGDSMGEMFMYYAASDLAFIGGSLLPLGGQNLIEACALGKPVLIGEHTFNFEAITQDAIATGAAIRVASARNLMQQVDKLLTVPDTLHKIGDIARDFAQRQQGATQRTLALLTSLLKEKTDESC